MQKIVSLICKNNLLSGPFQKLCGYCTQVVLTNGHFILMPRYFMGSGAGGADDLWLSNQASETQNQASQT